MLNTLKYIITNFEDCESLQKEHIRFIILDLTWSRQTENLKVVTFSMKIEIYHTNIIFRTFFFKKKSMNDAKVFSRFKRFFKSDVASSHLDTIQYLFQFAIFY